MIQNNGCKGPEGPEIAVLKGYCLKRRRSFGRGRHLWGNDDEKMKEGRRELK